MKLDKLKATTVFAVILLMASAMLTLSGQSAYAQLAANQPYSGPLKPGDVPGATSATAAYLNTGPNPVGVGQEIAVNFWVVPSASTDRDYRDYTVTITKPDGTKEVFTRDPPFADSTDWFPYIPDQVGEYKLKFDFLGCYFPAGYYTNNYRVTNTSGTEYVISMYFSPSSTERTIIVQPDMVYSYPPAPLPTDYWTRPVEPEHRDWWPILGSYPGTGYTGGGTLWDQTYPDTNTMWSAEYAFTPYVQGPNSAHIVWKRQGALAGLVGAEAGQYSATGNPGSPSCVYAGRCYQTMTVPINGVPTSCAVCYDLRTGEQYYAIPTAQGGITPTIVSYVSPIASALTGRSAPTMAFSVELLSISGGRLMKVNPYTGALTLNVSISPLTTGTYYTHGSTGGGPYVLSVQDLGAAAASAPGGRYRLINWTTRGTSSTLAGRIISNTTYATWRLPAKNDYNSDFGARIWWAGGAEANPYVGNMTVGQYHIGEYTTTNIEIYRLSTGEWLYNASYPAYLFNPSTAVADHGKVAAVFMLNTETGTKRGGFLAAWDLSSGKLAWESDEMEPPWGNFGAYAISSAYGLIFYSTYDGIYAINWTNGKIAWHYQALAVAPFEGPYYSQGNATGLFPFMSGCQIADGKLYISNSEHTETQPLVRGWSTYCLNATTGELIWKIQLTGNFPSAAIADGYLVTANSRDGYTYAFGKGKSATTVTAPDVVVPLGNGVVIKGTVLDMSPAQPGTPCVSKESMATQMEYLHKQMPIDGIWHNETITGVPVILTAIGSDGTVYDLGTVTTNGYYGTFAYAWTPPKEDTYTIMASFAGDESYGSSSAATAVSVGPAPASPTPTPEQPQAAPDNTPLIAATAAIMIAIAIVGALILLSLRKRQ